MHGSCRSRNDQADSVWSLVRTSCDVIHVMALGSSFCTPGFRPCQSSRARVEKHAASGCGARFGEVFFFRLREAAELPGVSGKSARTMPLLVRVVRAARRVGLVRCQIRLGFVMGAGDLHLHR